MPEIRRSQDKYNELMSRDNDGLENNSSKQFNS